MCFYNSMSKRALDTAKRYGRQVDLVEAARQIIEEQKRSGKVVSDIMEECYLIPAFPQKVAEYLLDFKKCLIVTSDEQIQVMEWGLTPGWIRVVSDNREDIKEAYVKAIDWRQKTINARCETLFEKKTFSEPALKRRCLIPSTGYFEYHHNDDKSKTPYFLHFIDEEMFSMAGIWNKWINPITKREIQTFSLITTIANPLVAEIHNGGNYAGRMPLLLSPEDEEKWLNPLLNEEEIKTFFKTPPDESMDAYKVSPKFRLMNPRDSLIIEKVA